MTRTILSTAALLACITSATADYDTVIEMRQQAEERRAQQALERMQREHFEINVERKREERREIRREGIREAHREFRRERESERDWEARELRENGVMCHERTTAIGLPAASEHGAETKAQERWSADVRWKYGERFMTLALARETKIECSQSSTQETVREKVEAAVGVIERRCSISAVPCRAQAQRIDR